MRLAAEQRGAGPALALVAGLAQVGRRWHRVVDLLASDYTVVSVDNRETGGTGPCGDGFTIADMGADVLETMDDLGHEYFFLAGHSMGGMIAQETLRQAPERVAAAVLLSTTGGASLYVPPENFGMIMNPDPKALWASLCGPGFAEAHPEVIEEEAVLSVEARTPVDGIGRQLQAAMAWDPGRWYDGIDVPVVVGHGDADPLTPYENGVRLAKHLGVELVTFEGAGHALETERPHELAALFRRVCS